MAYRWKPDENAAGVNIDDAPPSAGCGSPHEPEHAA
jgi:hypothetical protein